MNEYGLKPKHSVPCEHTIQMRLNTCRLSHWSWHPWPENALLLCCSVQPSAVLRCSTSVLSIAVATKDTWLLSNPHVVRGT